MYLIYLHLKSFQFIFYFILEIFFMHIINTYKLYYKINKKNEHSKINDSKSKIVK